jgi:hypothetical protein
MKTICHPHKEGDVKLKAPFVIGGSIINVVYLQAAALYCPRGHVTGGTDAEAQL